MSKNIQEELVKMKTKLAIYERLFDILNQRIENAHVAMLSIEESKNNETKSSAGDKFETNRAMMQREQDMKVAQLISATQLMDILLKIDVLKQLDTVKLGSLVYTDSGVFFISIGIGKVKVGNEQYYAISLDAPVGQLLNRKKIGDQVTFREREMRILDIQ